MTTHLFKLAITPLREAARWRCKACGLKRRRCVPAPKSLEQFGFMRPFWMYQHAGSVVWTNRPADCTRLRT